MIPSFSSLFRRCVDTPWNTEYLLTISCMKIDNFKWRSFQMEMTGISTSLFRTMMSNVKGDHRKKRRSRSLQPVRLPQGLMHPRGQEGGLSMKYFLEDGLRVIIFEYLTFLEMLKQVMFQMSYNYCLFLSRWEGSRRKEIFMHESSVNLPPLGAVPELSSCATGLKFKYVAVTVFATLLALTLWNA